MSEQFSAWLNWFWLNGTLDWLVIFCCDTDRQCGPMWNWIFQSIAQTTSSSNGKVLLQDSFKLIIVSLFGLPPFNFFYFLFFCVCVLSIIKTNQSGWAHHFLASFCCGAFHLLKFNSYDIANWTSLHFLITICFLKICKILIDLHSCVNKRLKLTD